MHKWFIFVIGSSNLAEVCIIRRYRVTVFFGRVAFSDLKWSFLVTSFITSLNRMLVNKRLTIFKILLFFNKQAASTRPWTTWQVKQMFMKHPCQLRRHEDPACETTGGPSSSSRMIILRKRRHGENIGVCMGTFTTAHRK